MTRLVLIALVLVFLALAPGPFLGCWAMAALRRRPEASRLAGGRR